MEKKKISKFVLKRLPGYLDYLKSLPEDGPSHISATTLANALGMGQVQVSLPLSFWRKLVYFVSIFLLAEFFGAASVFYAEPISDILGPIVSIPVCMKLLPKIMKHREEDLRPREYH